MPDIWDRVRQIDHDLDDLTDRITAERGRRQEIEAQIADATAKITYATDQSVIREIVVKLLQGLEATYQAQFQKKVASVVSRGLSIVFEEEMELKLETKTRGDLTTVDLKLIQEYGNNDFLETGLVGSVGGTIVVMLNILLRILMTMSAHPSMRRFLELDEPFGQADVDMIPAFGDLLRELSRKLGFQILMVTHEKVLTDIGDTAYQVVKNKAGVASVNQLHGRNERVA